MISNCFYLQILIEMSKLVDAISWKIFKMPRFPQFKVNQANLSLSLIRITTLKHFSIQVECKLRWIWLTVARALQFFVFCLSDMRPLNRNLHRTTVIDDFLNSSTEQFNILLKNWFEHCFREFFVLKLSLRS